MNPNINKWLRFSFVNLFIVALLGVVMRYKIGFEFPYFDQKHLQHAHSHFAFAGWVGHTIYTLFILYLFKQTGNYAKRYNILILLNLVTAYGMLFSFSIWGYNTISICLSTLNVLTGYAFAYYLIKDLRNTDKNAATPWIKAALVFQVISSAGTFVLAYMMATKSIVQDIYLASVYFYLHFQYNGFFLFACFGLLISSMQLNTHLSKQVNQVFLMMAFACIPAYFLSTLWMKIPVFVYILVIIAAILQVFGWTKFISIIYHNKQVLTLPKGVGAFMLLAAISFTIKILLQLGSVIPQISKLAFGFRNIVIAYLHLILLAVITGFLLSYIFSFVLKRNQKQAVRSLWVFTLGIYLNELLLGIIGIASFSYSLIPKGNEALFAAALIMLLGIGSLLFTVNFHDENHTKQA